GPEASIARLIQHAATVGWPATRLAVSHAFHSPLMAGMIDELGARAAQIRYRAPRIPLISAVTGALAGEEVAHAAHWTRHVLAPVRFHQALAALPDDVDAVIELGPQPVLTAIAERAGGAGDRRWLACARPGREDATLLEAVAALHEGGVELDLARVFAAGRPRIALPAYPWQRRSYWIEAAPPVLPAAPIAPIALELVVDPVVDPTLELTLDPALDLVHQQLEVMRQQLGLLAGALDADTALHS
ncbi:MAG: acyltransferase domain-containing protein, partial [Kofleriaceae bacterium]